jgi:hypothetical protein
MLGAPAGTDIVWVLVATGVMVSVFAPLTMRLLRAHD